MPIFAVQNTLFFPIRVMKDREHLIVFPGRGLGHKHQQENFRMIECAPGTVLAITYSCRGVEFIRGYCRMAIFDEWGLYCDKPFRRASDAAMTRSWAESWKPSLLIFRATRLEIVKEQDWMRQSD